MRQVGGTNCTFSGSTGTAAVVAAAGSATNATCIFHNAQQNGKIEIEKQTNPAGGMGFGFTGTDLPGTADDTFTLNDDGVKTINNVPAGTYHVSENDPTPGYDLHEPHLHRPGQRLERFAEQPPGDDRRRPRRDRALHATRTPSGARSRSRRSPTPTTRPTPRTTSRSRPPNNLSGPFTLSDDETQTINNVPPGYLHRHRGRPRPRL